MANEEVIVTEPSTGGQKGVKLERYDLIPPLPLSMLARHYGIGARKYADRNWERGYKWSKSFGAMMRHAWLFWWGEEYDMHDTYCSPECTDHTNSHHLVAVAWHAFALLEFSRTCPQLDDRSKK